MPLLDALTQPDDAPAVLTTAEGTLSRHELLGWSAAVAADLAGAPVVAVHAVPGRSTVVAVVAGTWRPARPEEETTTARRSQGRRVSPRIP